MSELCLCYGCMNQYNREYTICPHCGLNPAEIPKEPFQLLPGSTLQKRYLIGKMMGSGSFTVTYIGFDIQRKKKVVIKEYLPNEYATRIANRPMITVTEKAEEEDRYIKGLDSFMQEGRKIAALEHMEGAAQVLDVFMENNTAYIVLEYIEGQLLSVKLKKEGRLDPDRTVRMLMPVLDALKQIHGQGVLHKDISPEHLIWTENDKLRLIEFGFARSIPKNRSRSLTVIIKPGYTPAEQYSDMSKTGPWTDIYSIAAVAYKMMTGMTPPDGMKRQIKECMVSPSEMGIQIPINVQTAVENAMHVDYRQRIQTVDQFRQQLTEPSSAEPHRQYKRKSVLSDHSGVHAGADNMVAGRKKLDLSGEIKLGRLRLPQWTLILFGMLIVMLLTVCLIIAVKPGNVLNPKVMIMTTRGSTIEATRSIDRFTNATVLKSEYSDSVEVDMVVRVEQANNDNGDIILSAGSKNVSRLVIPAVIGLSKKEAEEKLKSKGFKNVESKEYTGTSDFAAGYVDNIKITDSGKEIAEEYRERTFNPDQTKITLMIAKEQDSKDEHTDADSNEKTESDENPAIELKNVKGAYQCDIKGFKNQYYRKTARQKKIIVEYKEDETVRDGRVVDYKNKAENSDILLVTIVENDLQYLPYLKGMKWEESDAEDMNAKAILTEAGLIGETDKEDNKNGFRNIYFKYLDDKGVSDEDKKAAAYYQEGLIYKTEPEYYRAVSRNSSITLYINKKKPADVVRQQSSQTLESVSEQTQSTEDSHTETVSSENPSQQSTKNASGNASVPTRSRVIQTTVHNTQLNQINPGSGNGSAVSGQSVSISSQSSSKPAQATSKTSQQSSKPAQESSKTSQQSSKSDQFSKQASNPTLRSLEIAKMPDKTEYAMSEPFDAAGLVVNAVYSDGSKKKLNEGEYEINSNQFHSENFGSKRIVVRFKGRNTDFTVNVKYYCQGKCGENVTYQLSEDGVLIIAGKGKEMHDYSNSTAPWSGNNSAFINEVKISGVTNIGSAAFDECVNLTTVTMDNKVTNIDENAFHNCSSITAIEIPDSVTTIGAWAFNGCTNIKTLTIPASVTYVGKYAFKEWTNQQQIQFMNYDGIQHDSAWLSECNANYIDQNGEGFTIS